MAWSNADVWIVEYLVRTHNVNRDSLIETLRIENPVVYNDEYPVQGDIRNGNTKFREGMQGR